MSEVIFWSPILAAAVASLRLLFATKRYLRFDHAIATVFAVQIIVGLALWKLHFVWHGM